MDARLRGRAKHPPSPYKEPLRLQGSLQTGSHASAPSGQRWNRKKTKKNKKKQKPWLLQRLELSLIECQRLVFYNRQNTRLGNSSRPHQMFHGRQQRARPTTPGPLDSFSR